MQQHFIYNNKDIASILDYFLRQDGYKLKHKDILSKLGELSKIKEADQYFEKAEMQPQLPNGDPNGINQGGIANQGAGASVPPVPNQQVMPGNAGVPVPGAGQGIPVTQ